MKGKLSVVGMTILLVALMVSSTQAFTIFFWRHDNNLAVIDPVYNASMTATASLTRALDSLGLEYTINSNLPSADQLCEYDVMMTSLSFLCPGWGGGTPAAQIGERERGIIAEYLDGGGAVYIEGNDFARDHRTFEDFWPYFHAAFEHDGVNFEVTRVECTENQRLGERSHGYPANLNSGNIPDRMSLGDGGEVILFDQTGRNNYLRGIMYYGNYRTYAQTVCFINFDNSRGFDRDDFLSDVLNELTGYGGTFTGRVVNNMTEDPVDNAEVFINECRATCTTDLLGNFRFENIPVEQFTVNVNRWGYTPVEEVEFNFNGEMELNAELRMLHPEMVIDPGQISVELMTGQSTTQGVGIRNVGDGPLEFTSRLRGAQVAGDLWEEMVSFDAGAITGDVRLQDVVFFQDHFWFIGGQDAETPNMLYKVSLEGEVVASWEQQSYSNYGWRNITTDGDYLYGVDSTYIAQINPEDGQVTGLQIPTGLNPCYAITYEAGRDLFWVSSVATDIYAVDREGNRIATVSNDLRFRISGLAWFEEDPDGYKLYLLNNMRDEDRNPYVSLDKLNHETSEAIHLRNLPIVNDERSGGCSFCNELYDFTWAFLVQMQAAEDWLRIYEAASDFFWLNVEPVSGALEPGNTMQMNIEFNTADLEIDNTYHSYLMIEHNTPVEGALWIDLSMTVTANDVTDKTDVPLEYGLTTVYPNPFNAVSNVGFTLDRASNVRLTLHDVTGRPVATLLEERLPVGSYKVPIDGSHLPSGTYFVRLADDARVSISKVALLK